MSELTYPFTDTPEAGTTIQVSEGVLWLRMPLPMALDHINLYLIEDDDGWWIVDTGMNWGKVKEHWQTIFDNCLGGKSVKGLLITHMHPDHIGQAGWLCDKFKIPMHITFGEYYCAQMLSKMTVDDLSWSTEAYYRSIGFEDSFFTNMKDNFHGYGSIIEPIPVAFQRITEGDVLTIGGREWQVICGAGHSPEHACFYCRESSVLISGDQIIPRITSNVSVMPTEPNANPLACWMDSLYKFRKLPEGTLVLPAHNTPFYGLRPRIDYLIKHHEDHLLALEEACVEGQRAVDLLPVLFKRKLDDQQMTMAVGECVAHLNYLLNLQQLNKTIDEQGVYWYHSIDPTLDKRARPGTHHLDDGPMLV